VAGVADDREIVTVCANPRDGRLRATCADRTTVVVHEGEKRDGAAGQEAARHYGVAWESARLEGLVSGWRRHQRWLLVVAKRGRGGPSASGKD
jgi:hypothetical protein